MAAYLNLHKSSPATMDGATAAAYAGALAYFTSPPANPTKAQLQQLKTWAAILDTFNNGGVDKLNHCGSEILR
ncbi:MAG: hypothetical protein ABIS03_05615, partial [Gemmatimonadaceae bacterium]